MKQVVQRVDNPPHTLYAIYALLYSVNKAAVLSIYIL